MGLPLQLAIAVAKQGQKQPFGCFTPDDDDEIQKQFHGNSTWKRELAETIFKEMAFVQISLKTEPQNEDVGLIAKLLKVLETHGYNKNYSFY